MSAPRERSVSIGGHACRVWEKGDGEPVGYLAGLGGLLRWTPCLDRLARTRRVVAPSLPGFPGGLGHAELDGPLDWIAATLDLLEESGLEGADLVGVSIGATLAAEAAAFGRVRRLALIAPFGFFDAREPVTDVWAQTPSAAAEILSAHPERLAELAIPPEDADPVEWQILQTRASEAAARLLWPTTDTGIAKRLHRVRVPTLLLWGSEDAVVPASYAKRFAEGIRGDVQLRSIAGAGHLADLDEPDVVADAILEFLG